MAETASTDEVDREVLQSFNGLDPSLLAAMLDSGEVDEPLICRLWQSWPQDTRNTVVREVCSEIRELLVREIPDTPSLTEALIAALGLDEVKKLMNLLLQKAKLDATSPLKNRVVAVTKTLVALRAAPKRGSPSSPSGLHTSNLSTLAPTSYNRPTPAQLLPSPSSRRNIQVTLSTDKARLTPAPSPIKSNPILRPNIVVQTQDSSSAPTDGLDRAEDSNCPTTAPRSFDFADPHFLQHDPSPQPALPPPHPCSPKAAAASHVGPSVATVGPPSAPSPTLAPLSLEAEATRQATSDPAPASPTRHLERQTQSRSPSPSVAEHRNPASSVPPTQEVLQAENHDDSTAPATDSEDARSDPGSSKETAAVNMSLDGEDEDLKFHPRGWSVELNAKKVAEWGLENAIDNDKRHTAAARTEWMYQSRLKGRTEQEYADLAASEFQTFAAMPPLVRKEAGMVFNKTSKFDYEAQVLLGIVAFEYCKMPPEEGRNYLSKSLKKLEKRLPDISPNHPKRRIDAEGVEPVRQWWNDVKTWITTVAGKMRKLLDAKGNAIELLDVPKKSAKYDPTDLLGRKRAGVAYNLWGATDKGKKVCNPLIEKALAEWVAANPTVAEDGRKKGQRALVFTQNTRKEQFKLQGEDIKAHFHKEAKTPDVPQTDEQRQAATEACLPWVIQILKQAATILDMHVVVMMSGKSLGGGVPVIVKEFTSNEVEMESFLDNNTVGGRAKAEYLSYASSFHRADPAQLQLYDRSVVEAIEKEPKEDPPDHSAHTSAAASAKEPNQKAKSMHRVFDPPSKLKKRTSKGEWMSRFLAQWFASVFAEKINWTKVSRDNSRYIELGRLPKDPAGRTIQLMNPTAMTDDSFNLLWDHLYKSTRGQLADDVRFLWHGEDLHFNLPTVRPPADPSVHVAGEQAAKTNLGKRKRHTKKQTTKKGDSSCKKKKLDSDAIVDDDLDELLETPEPTQLPNTGRTSTRALRPHKSATKTQNAPESDLESSVSGSDGEYAPEDEDAREHIDLGAYDDEAMDESNSEQDLEGGEGSTEAKHENLSPANGASSSDGGAVDAVAMEVDLPTVGVAESKHPEDTCTSVEERDRALGGDSGVADEEGVTDEEGVEDEEGVADEEGVEDEEGVDSRSLGLAEEVALPVDSSPEDTSDQDCDAADWGPQSSSAVDADRPLVEISLDAPNSQRHSPLESPAWVRFMSHLMLFGKKMSGFGISSRDITLSQGAGKACSITVPPALNCAVAIMQIWLSQQQHDPRKPDVAVAIDPLLSLSSVLPRHHVRQAVELVLDVTKPLPTPKNLEVNLALIPSALDALYTQFELGLVQFLFDLTASKDAVRYSDAGLLTTLRLASFIHASAFLRDPAKQGSTSRRVEEMLDRFVIVLAGVAAVRYMQEFLGSAVDEWVRKSRPLDPAISAMWLALKLLWSPGIGSLARALVVGRADLFADRWAQSHLPPPTMAIVRHLLSNPAWWETPNSGVPQPFQFGTKQALFTPSLAASIAASNWSLLTFLDRSTILLLLLACAVQLSEDVHRKDEDVLGFTELIHTCASSITGSDTEDGPFFSSTFHDKATQTEVRGWIAVWESERTVVLSAEEVPDDDSPSAPSFSAQRLADPAPEVESCGISQAPSHTSPSPAPPAEPTAVNSPVAAEQGSVDPVMSAAGDTAGVQEEAGDSAECPTKPKAKKKKVRVGRPTIPEPSVGAAVNPKERLRDAVKKAEASGRLIQLQEERPRRAATLKSLYVSRMPALQAKAEVNEATASPEKKSASAKIGRKKPAALQKKAEAANKVASPSTKRRAPVKQPTTSKRAATEQLDVPLTPAQKRAATIAKKKAAAALAASTGSKAQAA